MSARANGREILRLAWPAAASFTLNNFYRINDQFWIQGLGEGAQAAVGASMFALIMSFALAFLGAGGALSLVARAVGAGDEQRMHAVIRHTLLLSLTLGGAVSIASTAIVEPLVGWIGLSGDSARFGREYLGVLLGGAALMYLVPALDNVFIGRGRTRIPMALNVLAISINFVANPLLIYGTGAVEALPDWPIARVLSSVAGALGIEGMGMAGAAWATLASRAVAVAVGLVILSWGFGTRLVPRGPARLSLMRELTAVSAPASLSIALYAGVYWLLLGLVLSRQPLAAVAGLGIGFQVFEGLSYPIFLGIGMATASLVGQRLGARDAPGALEVVGAARRVARWASLAITILFLLLADPVGALFTQDPEVLAQVVLYVRILAVSQYFVAVETLNERVLLGAGLTRSIPWISGSGNAMRVPLGWLLAIGLGLGPAGVWWAIVATSAYKAGMFRREVERRAWLARLGT